LLRMHWRRSWARKVTLKRAVRIQRVLNCKFSIFSFVLFLNNRPQSEDLAPKLSKLPPSPCPTTTTLASSTPAARTSSATSPSHSESPVPHHRLGPYGHSRRHPRRFYLSRLQSLQPRRRRPGDVVKKILKADVEDLVRLNTKKTLVGSAMAGSVGGFNTHAANVLTAVYLATGQDPAQNVENSQCLTFMEACVFLPLTHLTVPSCFPESPLPVPRPPSSPSRRHALSSTPTFSKVTQNYDILSRASRTVVPL
jgi:hypothetical protein